MNSGDRRRCDPAAAALGNASGLGLGYFMLRRFRLGAAAAGTTVVLLTVLAVIGQPAWFWRAVVLMWLAVSAAHGRRLAGGRFRRANDGPRSVHLMNARRLIAGGAVVLPAVALIAVGVDAAHIEREASERHSAGDCEEALTVIEGIGPLHRVANGPAAGRAQDAAEACEILVSAQRTAELDPQEVAEALRSYGRHPGAAWAGSEDWRADLLLDLAAADFEAGLAGDSSALLEGFWYLSTVVDQIPARSGDALAVLDEFLGDLPLDDACGTKEIAEWLQDRQPSENELDRSFEVLPDFAPQAILECAEARLASGEPELAGETYQELIDRYPEHELVGAAEEGLVAVEVAIADREEYERVLELFEGVGIPDYCEDPAAYSKAAPFEGDGPHPMLVFGDDENVDALPGAWLAGGIDSAVLVVCTDGQSHGGNLGTCGEYWPPGFEVTIWAMRIPVRVYELRTGKLIIETEIEIGGSCPETIEFFGRPPSEIYAVPSDGDVRSAYEQLAYL